MTTTLRHAPWAEHGHFQPGDTVVYLDPRREMREATVTRPDHVQPDGLDEVLVVGDRRHRFRHELGCRGCSADPHRQRRRAAQVLAAAAVAMVALSGLYLLREGTPS